MATKGKTTKATATRLDETPSEPVLVVADMNPKESWQESKTFKVGMEIVEAKVTTERRQLEEAKNKGGRPTIFSKDLAFSICERIVNGESLRSILKDDGMPAMGTIFRWLDENPWFKEQYTWSKDNQADTNSEDIQDLAKRVVLGEVEPQAARVAIDAYKWTASKLKPKKYGDKLDLTSDGKQLPQPIIGIGVMQPPQEKIDG